MINLIFVFFEKIPIEDLEKSIENVLKQYKKALIMKKFNEISKDFN